MVVLIGKESGDPTVPAQGIVSERQDGCLPPVCGGPGTCSWPRDTMLYESRTLPRAHVRQVKETVHLVGNNTSWWDDRAGIDLLVVLAAVVVRDSSKKGQR